MVMRMVLNAAVAGASGYAGGEVLRILAGHPGIDVVTVTSGKSAGHTLGEVQPHLAPLAGLRLKPTSAEVLAPHDIVFLALPHGQSGSLAAQIEATGATPILVDCAADHRLTSRAQWEHYYGGSYAPAWTYGMPELLHAGEQRARAQREALRATRHIAVPGCNVTAVTLALQPAVAQGLVDPTHVVATLAVGYSGAGRAPRADLQAASALGAMRPYAVGGSHRHIPEIVQNLEGAGGAGVRVAFTPVLVPASRGILATVSAPLAVGVDDEDVDGAYAQAYGPEPLIQLTHGEPPRTAPMLGTGRAQVGAWVDRRADALTAICSLDNLGKGTAGAAVQSANLALGAEETTAIPQIGVEP